MKVLILCGGRGARMSMAGDRDDNGVIPKPMVEIGGKPILSHIMDSYRRHGLNEFVLATGYRGELIHEYYQDVLGVACIDTGKDTQTGGRVLRCADRLGKRFMLTYGDGLSDIDLSELLAWHLDQGCLATVTGVAVHHPMGIMDCTDAGRVIRFREKPLLDGYGNGGFYVMERAALDYLSGDKCILERIPLETLAAEGELCCYRHGGYWAKMDNHSEWLALNELWNKGDAPWAK